MINLKELRIGNFIKSTKKTVFSNKSDFVKISEDVIKAHLLFDIYTKHYDYIELTPKLLEKLGFTIKPSFLGLHEISIKYNSNRFQTMISFNDKKSLLRYVHQLQNRFYSHEGIELMDIVAYNYYLNQETITQIVKLDFNNFCNKEIINSINNKISPFKDSIYKLGDLPKDLFI